MGIILYKYPLNNYITYDEVYLNVRNIQLNKEKDNFTVSAQYFIYYRSHLVDIKYIKIQQNSMYTENIWCLIYNLIKQNLRVLKCSFLDY